MPRDSNGIYNLPSGYLAVQGDTIQPSQHNPPLEDIAQALTNSLPRNGAAPMTGPLKAVDGSAAAPALAFNSTAGLGLFKTANGLGVAVAGQPVFEFTSAGTIGLPIGTPIPVLDDTLPPLCVWADGRNISRTSYASLFAKWSTKYGAGDGSTTFGIPDMRGVPLVGRDNIGGTDAARLGGVPVVSGDRLTTGSVIGESFHTLTTAEVGAHTHNISVFGLVNDIYPTFQTLTLSQAAPQINVSIATSSSTVQTGVTSTGTSAANSGGGAHNTVQRSLLCNFTIYAGA